MKAKVKCTEVEGVEPHSLEEDRLRDEMLVITLVQQHSSVILDMLLNFVF